jgi:UDP-N-acetylglucosamine--N-acetylmuramyl-(pentapeptide) pyrophosphoryl-undecaprenol N-acetylglucosamine transferase
MQYKVIIAGGGTGGHVFPAIAIANALKKLKPDTDILFVGAIGKMEMEKVPQAGYKIEGLDIAGLNRSNWWKNISLPLKILRSLQQAKIIIKNFRPDVVVGVGGYASFPMLKTAQKNKIATVIQEQNSFAGKTNQMLGKKAKKICVAYDGMEKFFPEEKIIYTGNPIRESIAHNNISKNTACREFQLNPAKKIILVVGGSLGAKSINEAIDKHINELEQHHVQLIWQTGQLYAARAKEVTKGKESFLKVFEFISRMDYAYAAADVIISRAGSTISELSVVKKPAVLVPYPFAAEDHQTQNALSLVRKDAALMVKDADAKNELIKKVLMLCEDDKMQEILINNITPLGIPDADKRIATEILQLLDSTITIKTD